MPQDDTGQEQDNGLANPFLNNIPEPDREVVGKYIQDWDRGVTNRFQEIHEQYRPYKELEKQYGGWDNVQAAMEVYDLLETNPKYVYEEIGKQLGLTGAEVKEAVETDNKAPSGTKIPDELSEFLGPLQKQIEQQQQVLQALAQQTVQSTTAQREAQEDAMLDKLLADMHEAHGDFDEDYVLLMMHNDMEPEDAIQAWQDMLGQYTGNENQQRFAPLPPTLSGGQVPGSQKGVADMDRKDVQGLVANLMAGVQQNSG